MTKSNNTTFKLTADNQQSLSLTLLASGLLVALSGSAQAAAAAPSLNFWQGAQVWNNIDASYESPILGSVSFTLNGANDYQWANGQIAQANYHIEANQGSITDPIYSIITTGGNFGFDSAAQAQVLGTKLKTQTQSSVTNSAGDLVNNADNATLRSSSYANWGQQLYIGANATHQAGSYGAILVGITLDGTFPALADSSVQNDSSAYLNAQTSFTDIAGVSYNSSFGIQTGSYDLDWTGASTVYKKLLFQYGTIFNLQLYQQAYTNNNGNADFFNTGSISSIELPLDAILDSGAQQAGLGGLSELFGTVTHSTSLTAQNTTWDFGNNGGGFTPPSNVPVPAAAWMFASGLLGMMGLRRRVAK